MKKRLLLLILFLVALATVMRVNPVFANHVGDKRFVFHWINKTTVEMRDTARGTSAQFTASSTNDDKFIGGVRSYDVSFLGQVDFSKEDGCPDKRGIQFFIAKDDYQNIDTTKPTAIKSGNYGAGGNRTCSISDALVNQLRDDSVTIGFITKASDGTVTDMDSFKASAEVDTNSGESCESRGEALGWILCPVITLIDKGLGWVDTQIQALLEIDQDYYNNTGIKSAWTQIRNVAYIILIPIMLFMVIGTALGFTAIDAYTVKKALPRMVAAVIFISLSYYIAVFLIQFFNVVGGGILGLLTSPFRDAAGKTAGMMSLADFFAPGTGGGEVLGYILALPKAIAAGAAIIVILGLFGGTMFLFAAIAFLVLMFRQMLVIALLLVAPLAILAWIFPGNDRLWKNWWGAFWKLLFMFPLIMGLIAMGRIFAFIINSNEISQGSQGADNIMLPIMKLTAYMLPYAFIPFTFKFAGGLFATVSGFAQDRSKGLFDRQKQGRAQKIQNFKTGDLGDGNKFIPGSRTFKKGVNAIGRNVGTGWRGHYGLGARGKAAKDIGARAGAAEAMKDPMMNQLQFDDDGILAMALSGGTRDGAKQALVDYRERLRRHGLVREAEKWTDERINKAAETASAVGINRSKATAAMDMMARNKSFALAGGAAGMETMIEATNRLSGGNKQMADNLMGSFEFNSRQAGRYDLGMHDYAVGEADMDGAWGKAGLYQMATGTTASMEAFGDHWTRELREGLDSGDIERIKKAKVAKTEFKAMLPNATASNQAVINKTLAEMEMMERNQNDYISSLAPTDQATVRKTMQDIDNAAEVQARTYERIDPNKIET